MAKITKKGWVQLPTKKLVKADWNYKEDDEEKAATLTANIRRNGQIENIIVREVDGGKFEVANGNHRVDSFLDLKFKTCICYNLGPVSEQEAKRVAVETNETRFNSDRTALASIIHELGFAADAEFDLADLVETMPYDETELKGFSDLLNFDWSSFEQKRVPPPNSGDEDGDSGPTGEGGGARIICCPHCEGEINLDDLENT